MKIILLTAIGVGSATIVGAIFGLIFQKVSHKFSDTVLGFAAGVMLAAAINGLILQSIEIAQFYPLLTAIVGIFAGALFVNLSDSIIPHLHRLDSGSNPECKSKKRRADRVMLFVMAIAIHNFPEGIAAGVGFGTGNTGEAIAIACGIAIQNIPEGMVIISPMLSAGISRRKTFAIAALTGLIEIVGTLLGYFAAGLSAAILPFALAFAGGTMLYIISDEMIPETHAHGSERSATYALLAGFCLMTVIDHLL